MIPHTFTSRAQSQIPLGSLALLCLLTLPGVAEGARDDLKRGPYLQLGTPTSMVLRWRTDTPSDSVVRYGLSPQAMTQQASAPANSVEHSVSLEGLSPGTRYYYSVGSSAEILTGGDGDLTFRTNPVAGTVTRSRFWVIGDSGTPLTGAVRDAYEGYAAGAPTDLWLMLGDNAYPDGRDAEYQLSVFNIYQDLLASSVLWSTLGNHDAKSAESAGETGPYYQIFDFPKGGQAGGVASGTEAYYSFDYGHVHFVCLNSQDVDRSAGGAMAQWLTQDLSQNLQPWTVAFWHHPPYSKGSHDSDEDGALIQMRENIVPILEDFGVDLVLGGHSHAYERSFLIDGHYGLSDTIEPWMVLDAGDGRPEGDGAYGKASVAANAHEGAVYVVAGHSGIVDYEGRLNHPAMYVGIRRMGSVVLDVIDNVLEMTMIDASGKVQDTFSLVKGVDRVPSPPGEVRVTASGGGNALTWTDGSSNETGFVVERSPDGNNWAVLTTLPAGTTAYTDAAGAGQSGLLYRVQARNAAGGSALIRSSYVEPLEDSCGAFRSGLIVWEPAPGTDPNEGRLFIGYFLGVLGALGLRRRRR